MELDNENIDATIEDIRTFFEKEHVPCKDVLKICLVVEEYAAAYELRKGRNDLSL